MTAPVRPTAQQLARAAMELRIRRDEWQRLAGLAHDCAQKPSPRQTEWRAIAAEREGMAAELELVANWLDEQEGRDVAH